MVEGQGHVVYEGGLEADFDFSAPLNEGLIHFNYGSKTGASFRGIDFHGPFDCTIDHLTTDFSTWNLQDAQIYIPANFPRSSWLQGDVSVDGNLSFNTDFSVVSCSLKDGYFPLEGKTFHIQDFEGAKQNDRVCADFHCDGHKVQIGMEMEPVIAGTVILGEGKRPMTIDWEYSDRLFVHSIEGSFLGIDAWFQSVQPNHLVGKASLDFQDLYYLGDGFTFNGQLQIEKNKPHFTGVVTGKDFVFAEHQFKTLFANIDWKWDWLKLSNLSVSDMAGHLNVDQAIIEKNRVTVPEITVTDFRPSYLKKIGEEMEEINPFVVKEFKLRELKGDLLDINTLTAYGTLDFINSFQREKTIFHAPADLLSRIFGLDLELLIPVRGTLNYQLSNGFFTILDVRDVFSENSRSEFFLTSEPATVDLYGNVNISIQMKQFVLFKFTEAFLISVDGKLNDPQFHLQNKKPRTR